MKLKPIKSEKDYEEALARFEEIFDAKAGTPEGDEAEILALLIENYENTTHSIDPPDPVAAIQFRMEQLNLEQKDLAGILGSKSRVSEILNRKRRLTLPMIRKLHQKLNIPYESLMGKYSINNTGEQVEN